MSRLLTSNGNLSLPYRMSSINNSFERLEMSQGGKIALRPFINETIYQVVRKTWGVWRTVTSRLATRLS